MTWQSFRLAWLLLDQNKTKNNGAHVIRRERESWIRGRCMPALEVGNGVETQAPELPFIAA